MPLGTSDADLDGLAKPQNPHAVRVLSKPDRNGHMCGQRFIALHDDKSSFGRDCVLNVRFADGKARKKIFIGGLLPGSTEQDLQAVASRYGTVLSAKILAKNERAPCGFVVFASPQQAESCIASMDNTPNADGSKNYVEEIFLYFFFSF